MERHAEGKHRQMPYNIDFFNKIREGADKMPKRQREVCSFLLGNHQSAAFMTVQALADATGTSPTTIMRTVKKLGYDSFIAFQKDLRNLVITGNSSVWWRIEESVCRAGETGSENCLENISRENVAAINKCLTESNIHAVNRSLDTLEAAREIYILGLRTSSGAAAAFFGVLHQMLPNVKIPSEHGSDNMYEFLLDMTPRDALIAISVGGPHYAVRTINAIRYAHKKGVPVILVTDDLANPAVPFSQEAIRIAQTVTHYSLVPVLTVLDSFLAGLGKRKKKTVLPRLQALNELLIEEEVNN